MAFFARLTTELDLLFGLKRAPLPLQQEIINKQKPQPKPARPKASLPLLVKAEEANRLQATNGDNALQIVGLKPTDAALYRHVNPRTYGHTAGPNSGVAAGSMPVMLHSSETVPAPVEAALKGVGMATGVGNLPLKELDILKTVAKIQLDLVSPAIVAVFAPGDLTPAQRDAAVYGQTVTSAQSAELKKSIRPPKNKLDLIAEDKE